MSTEVFQFEDITVDLRRMTLSRGGQQIPLEPKTFDVLRYLIEHRDRLVTKEELLDAAWKDTFVTPNVLTRAIAQLRKALGDDAFEAKYIETVAKRGYRFIAPIHPQPDGVQSVSATPVVQPADTRSSVPVHRRLPVWPVWLTVIVLAAAGLAMYASRDPVPADSSPTPSAFAPRRFTTGSESYSYPSISPDGGTIAYSSNRTGSMEIYTRGVAQGSKELAITSDGGQNMHVSWSPDGQWLAYHSRKKGGVWIVPSSGGTPRQVVDFGSQPSWTHDGRRIVFASGAGGMAAQSTLWTVDREGNDRRELSKLGAPRGGHAQPTVSSDGRFVAFTVSHGHIGTEVWTIPASGGAAVKVAPGGEPRFSADGSALYWVNPTREGTDALMRVSVNDRGAAAGTPELVQQFPGMFIGGFSIARTGAAAMWLFQAAANLWAVDVRSRGEQVGAIRALTSDEVRNSQPQHSRDGRIAFHQFSAGQPPTAWLMDEDGKNREPLTSGLSVGVWGPQWASDGKRLLVIVAGFSRKASLAWLDIATRQLAEIPISIEGMLSPSLSPDGREIAAHVIDEGGVINVWVQPLDGGARRQLTFDGEAMSYPVWSSDGKSVAIEIKRGDDTQIGVIPKEGGPVELLVTERGQSWPFSWSPDNEHIAFAGSRDGVWNVYAVSRKTKEVRQLTDFSSVEGYVRYPSWSHRRDSIVFERAEQRGSLWTVNLQ